MAIPRWKRGIYTIPETEEEPEKIIYYSDPVIPGTAIIPEPVRKIKEPAGTVISRVEKQEPTEIKADVPEAVKDVFTKGWFPTGWAAVEDFWRLIAGSPEEKLEGLVPYLPVDEPTREYIIEEGTGNGADWSKEPWFTIPGVEPVKIDFKFPDLGDLGKYALLGLIGLGGLYLAGQYLGRKK